VPIIKRPGTLRGETISPKDFVEIYDIENLICCFSGGKDSLVSTHYMFKSLRDSDSPKKYVIWVDTTVMLPSAEPFVRKVCERFDWPLVILKPRESFWELAFRRGNPTMFRRWCCYALKLEPIISFVRSLRGQSAEVTGLRRCESRKRRNISQVLFRKRTGSWGYSPIVDWSDKEVEDYILEHSLPKPPWYELGIKETCCCGAFSSVRQMRQICRLYPSFFRRFMELENKFRNRGAAFYFQNRPYSARRIWEEVHADNQASYAG